MEPHQMEAKEENGGDIDEAIVVRSRRGRETKKKQADDEKRVI